MSHSGELQLADLIFSAVKRLVGKPDTTAYQIIFFQGCKYLLIGEEEGPIATKKQYRNFETPFAHLHRNGEISRFGEIIGHKSDITFTGVYE